MRNHARGMVICQGAFAERRITSKDMSSTDTNFGSAYSSIHSKNKHTLHPDSIQYHSKNNIHTSTSISLLNLHIQTQPSPKAILTLNAASVPQHYAHSRPHQAPQPRA